MAKSPSLTDWLAGIGKRAAQQVAADLVKDMGQQARRQMAKGVHQAVLGDWGKQVGERIGARGIGAEASGVWPSWFTQILLRESGFVIPILGRRDSGKSSLAFTISEFVQKNDGSYIYVPGYPQHLAPSHVVPVPLKNLGELIHMAQPGSIILLDDASLIFNSKRTMTDAGLEFEDWVNTIAHAALRLLMTVQDSSDMHKAGLRGDVLIFKPPERMFMGSERPAMRPIIEQAVREFAKIPPPEIVKHAWVYRDPEHHQMIQYDLPKWLTRRRAKWRGRGATSDPLGRHSEQQQWKQGQGQGSGSDDGGIGGGDGYYGGVSG